MAKAYYTLPKIALIACGGTIGVEWSVVHDTVIPSKTGNKRLRDHIDQQIQLHRSLLFVDLFNKDSRAITDKDRDKIIAKIKNLRAKGIRHFLITHGTFTMTQTAAYLNDRCASKGLSDIYAVICGSMIPNFGFTLSDAQFNIGFALAKLSMMDEADQTGAWICMNGLLSRPENIVKNVKKARFEIKKK